MGVSLVNIGTAPNDGTGDPLRVAFDKINDNFIDVQGFTGVKLDVTAGTDITAALVTFLSGSSGPEDAYIGPGDYLVGNTGLITQVATRRLHLSPTTRLIQMDAVNPNIDLWVQPEFVQAIVSIEDTTTQILDNPVGDAGEGVTTEVSRVRVATLNGLAKGDRVKIYSNDIIPNENHRWLLPDDVFGQPAPLTKRFKKEGEFSFVSSTQEIRDGENNIIGYWVYLTNVLMFIRPGAIHPRIARFPDVSFEMSGGVFDYNDAAVAGDVSVNSSFLRTKGHFRPRVYGNTVARSVGTFWRAQGTYQGSYEPLGHSDGFYSPALNNFAYGVDCVATWQFMADLGSVDALRHGYDDNGPECFVDGSATFYPAGFDDPSNYGRPFQSVVRHRGGMANKNGQSGGHNSSTGCLIETSGTVFGTYPSARSGGPGDSFRGRDIVVHGGGLFWACHKGVGIQTTGDSHFSNFHAVDCTQIPLNFESGDFSVGFEGNLEATVSKSEFGAFNPLDNLMQLKTGMNTQVVAASVDASGMMTVTQLMSGNGTGLKAGSVVQFQTGAPLRITADNSSGSNGQTGTYQTDYTGTAIPAGRAVAGPSTAPRARLKLSKVTLSARGSITPGSNVFSPIFIGAWVGGVDVEFDDVTVDLRGLTGWSQANGINGVSLISVIGGLVRLRGKITILAGDNRISRPIQASEVTSSAQNFADVELEIIYEGRRDLSGTPVFDQWGTPYSSGSLMTMPNLRLKGTKKFGMEPVTCNFTANATTDVLTISAAAYAAAIAGDRLTVSSTTTVPAGLVAGTTYWLIKTATANQVQLATSRSNALAGVAIDITSTGTGTHTISIGGWEYDDGSYFVQSIAAAGVIGVSARLGDVNIRMTPTAELSGANAVTLSDRSGWGRGQKITLINSSAQFGMECSTFPGFWVPPRGSVTFVTSDDAPPTAVLVAKVGRGGNITLTSSRTIANAQGGYQVDGATFLCTAAGTTNLTLAGGLHSGWSARAIQKGAGALELRLTSGATWQDGSTTTKTTTINNGWDIYCESNADGASAVFRAVPI